MTGTDDVATPQDSGATDEDAGSTTEDTSADEDAGSTTEDTSADGGGGECNVDADCAALVGALGACQTATCSGGVCGIGDRPDGTACDDGSPCTAADACKGGQCAAGQSVDCDDSNDCTTDLCDQSSGQCVNSAVVDGASCGKDALCARVANASRRRPAWPLRTATCVKTAIHAPSVTPANRAPVRRARSRTAPTTTPASALAATVKGCISSPVTDGTTCDDGDKCTEIDACLAGACVGSKNTCSKPCGDGVCKPEDGENCGTCAADCKQCSKCGDGTCSAATGESCLTCAQDCGACAKTCGDGTCGGDETCTTCPLDCGKCVDNCGNGVCDSDKGETCGSCPADCKSGCKPQCGNGKCELGETSTTCAKDCGACDKGVCCDVKAKTFLPKQSQCADTAIATQVKCGGQVLWERSGRPGCIGTSATVCTKLAAYISWSPWKASQTCPSGTLCSAASKTCVQISDTKCTAGVCCDGSANKLSPKGDKCGSKPLKAAFKCDGQMLSKRLAYAGCTGTSSTQCSPSPTNYAWDDWSKLKDCDKSSKCVAKLGKCVSASPQCKAGVCCDTATGKYSSSGTKCGSKPSSTQVKCSGALLPGRAGYASCTGKSATTCSNAAALLVWGLWKTQLTCKLGTTCDAKTKTCSTTAAQCAKGTCCNVVTGKYKAVGTTCGAQVLKTLYQCKANALLKRQAVGGCTGKTGDCSTSLAHAVWGSWNTVKQCSKGTVCDAGKKMCVQSTTEQCTSGVCCNSVTKKFEPIGVKCGAATGLTKPVCVGAKTSTTSAYFACSGAAASCPNSNKYVAWVGSPKTSLCLLGCDVTSGKCKVPAGAECASGVCCNTIIKKYKSHGAKCGTSVETTKHICTVKVLGKYTMSQKQSGYQGCSGTASTCSNSSKDYSWQNSGLPTPCGKGCDTATGKCKPATGPQCSSGTCCNTFIKKYKAKATKCSSTVKKTTYVCTTKILGVFTISQKKVGYPGCTGSSTSCSTDPKYYYYWSNSGLPTPCGKGCDTSTGKCKTGPVPECTSGTCCNTFTKKYKAKATKCGSTVKKVSYVCTTKVAGSYKASQKRVAYQGCSGASKYCSASSAYDTWKNSGLPKPCFKGCNTSTGKCK